MSASPLPPLPPPPLPPPRRRDEYGVGGIGKTKAAGVICRCRGKNEGLLGVLKMDDKFRAKGPDLEESYEELSKSLVHNSGGHPWNLEDRVPSSTASQKNNGMRYWRSW